MLEQRIESIEELPTIEEYIALRGTLGWGPITGEEAQRTFNATTYSVCLRDGNQLVGLIRAVGDGVLYIFIADVMVDPEYAGQGLGDTLMRFAVQYIERVANPWATVTLIPLAGREAFYEPHGFERCPNAIFGPGMAYTKHLRTRDSALNRN